MSYPSRSNAMRFGSESQDLTTTLTLSFNFRPSSRYSRPSSRSMVYPKL